MEGGGNGSIIGEMKLRCPVCRKVINAAIQQESREGDFYPFCSQRCKMVDLGRWLDGNYKIITPLRPEDAEKIDESDADDHKGENAGQSGTKDR
ncbi:MAG: DNA gyrase inhibitor YacG [Sedimentisphaerales bacterium]|jgi:endogenous inhibitor of DNA gyrase (YacG/DUF329 family)